MLPLVGRYGGRTIDTAGDGILAEFPSVINATECAVEIQTVMATRNEGECRAPSEAGRRMAAGIPGARFVPLQASMGRHEGASLSDTGCGST